MSASLVVSKMSIRHRCKACIIKVGHRCIAGSKNVKKLPVHEKIPFLVWSFKYEYVTIKWKEKQSPAEEK